MLRNLAPVTTRHAIAAAIDSAQIVSLALPNAHITHVRLPTHDVSLRKTSSMAFIGLSSEDHVTQLDGQDYDRVAKRIPFIKSIQAPVLIPTGLAQQKRDEGWSKRAAIANLLVKKPNPFEFPPPQ